MVLNTDSPDWSKFETTDPFNSNLVAGKISHHSGDAYGALFIEKVNGIKCPQVILCTPKIGYPFDQNGNWHFPKAKQILRYEKLDGTNIFAYQYHDAKENKFVSYKTRLLPFVQESKFGPFLSMWKEMLVKYPEIPKFVLRHFNMSFELWGARNPHLVKYDLSLQASLLFVRTNGKVSPPLDSIDVLSDLYHFPQATFLGSVDRDYIYNYQEAQKTLESQLKEIEDGYLGQEGEVWYLLDEKGNWNLFKCLEGNTLVRTRNGWVKIKKIVNSNDDYEVLSLRPDGNFEYLPVTGKYKNKLGDRKVFRVGFKFSKHLGQFRKRVNWRPFSSSMKTFRGLLATEDHLFLTNNGYKKLNEITNTDKGYTGGFAPNDIQKQIIEGSLLGDGALSPAGGFRIIQTDIDYVKWKQNLLLSLGSKGFFSGPNKHSASRKDIYTTYISSSNWSRAERQRWYPKGKKIVPKDLVLTDLLVAIWFMDDGSLSKKGKTKRSRQHISFATMGFALEDIELLIRKMFEWCGEYGKIDNNNAIRFVNKQSDNIMKRINKYIPYSMERKRIKEKDIFDVSFFNEIPQPNLEMDYFILEEKFIGGKNTTVYCIDVEETHNFLTKMAGIVHNCKPETIEAIHWSAGGIGKNVIAVTIENSFENWNEPTIENIKTLLLEEFLGSEIEKVHYSIEKQLTKAIELHEFSNAVLEQYHLLGLSILDNKVNVMRILSSKYSKSLMGKVYSIVWNSEAK